MKLWRAFVELMDRREPATPLAVARALVGVVLTADMLTIARLQLVAALWSSPAAGGMGYAAQASRAWVLLGGGTGAALWLWGACTLSAVLFALGLFSRVWAVVFVLASAQLARILPEADRGIDQLMRIVLAILACSRADTTLSLSAWLSHRKLVRADVLVPAWPRYVLIGQVLWVYFSAATLKSQSLWTPLGGFTALYYVLLDPHFARFDLSPVRWLHPLMRLATFSTMAFEWLAPLMLLGFYYRATPERPGRVRAFANRFRLWHLWIVLGVTFHVSLAFLLRLGMFPYGLLALYPLFFRHDELNRAFAWVRGRLARVVA